MSMSKLSTSFRITRKVWQTLSQLQNDYEQKCDSLWCFKSTSEWLSERFQMAGNASSTFNKSSEWLWARCRMTGNASHTFSDSSEYLSARFRINRSILWNFSQPSKWVWAAVQLIGVFQKSFILLENDYQHESESLSACFRNLQP